MEDFAKVLIVCSFSLCSSNVANLETSRCSLLIQRWRVSLAFFVVSILVQFLGYNDAKPISRWFILPDRYFYCRVSVTRWVPVLLGKSTLSSFANVGKLIDF